MESTRPDTTGTSTRTLPAIHGVVLRLPAHLAKPPTGPPVPAAPLKSIDQLRAEADPVRALSQSGGVRLLKRSASEADPTRVSSGASTETAPSAAVSPRAVAPSAAPTSPSPESKALLPEATTAAPAPPAEAIPVQPPTRALDEKESPFILKPTASAAPAATLSSPSSAAPLLPFGLVVRRKAKMTELARIVLPPKREETEPPPAPPETSPTVVPPAFPVAAMTARAIKVTGANPESKRIPTVFIGAPFSQEKAVAEEKPSEAAPPVEPMTKDLAAPSGPPDGNTEAVLPGGTPPTGPEMSESGGLEGPLSAPADVTGEKSISPSSDAPKIDPEADKPEPSTSPLPQVDPEAHRPAPPPEPPPQVDPEAHKPEPPSPPVSPEALSAPVATPEKREFHLANGERVVGVVLSETPEAVYIDHGALGVLTIPRGQIAKRLVEIILINGDRIVGDIMAETADTLYVRHSSLGMLTVPRMQRSTRVVEAILKDGDRILGEILTETETFTVIRSATLGTITVPHNKVAMLNRKIEQIELKALPPPAPGITDKPPA